MFIQTEETPNPSSLKFFPGLPVLAKGVVEFKTEEAAKSGSPLAAALFRINGVAGVFMTTDYITVTKDADQDWAFLKAHILATLMTHFTSGLPVLHDAVGGASVSDLSARNEADTALLLRIQDVLDMYVRPAVARDGGDITLDSFEDGVLYVRMQGACSGCPSASATLKSGIENMLQTYVPEVIEVREAA
ncbi:MAG: NifU family protein [Pseudomonadota bacterium]